MCIYRHEQVGLGIIGRSLSNEFFIINISLPFLGGDVMSHQLVGLGPISSFKLI